MMKNSVYFRSSLFICALTFLGNTDALTPTPSKPQEQPIALVGATVHLGNGEKISNAVISFSDGIISGVHAQRPDLSGHRLIDVSGKHVYPGFVLPDSNLGLIEVDALPDTVDNQETGEINPNVRSLIAYNTDSEMIPTLRFNGVLTAQVSPKGGLVSGTSSIVRLDGWNWEDAALKVDDGIRMRCASRRSGRFDFATFTFKFSENKQYDEQAQRLQQLFQDARNYQRGQQPQNLKLEAMQGLFDGSKRLYIQCNDPRDIVVVIKLAQNQGVKKPVLIAASGALQIASFLKENEIPVIVSGLHNLPEQAHDAIDLPYRLPFLLTQAGVKTGLTYPSLMNSRNLGFIAGTAAAYGMDKASALRMITLSNAEILGIDEYVGSLKAGKHATLFVTSGDALDMRGNQISHAFIQGRQIELNGTQQQLYERFKTKYTEAETE